MDLSSIRGEMKDIDWKAIDAKKKSSESFKQKEYLGGGNNMQGTEAETLTGVLLFLRKRRKKQYSGLRRRIT